MGIQTARRTSKGGAIAAFVVLGIVGLGIWAAIFYKPAASTPQINTDNLATQIHTLINEERAMAGVPSLNYDNRLALIAEEHSEDMNQRNFYDHISPDGQTPRARYAEANYACASIGENLNQAAVGSNIPEYVVASWMNSPEHHDNILKVTYDREGIGIALSSDGTKVYVTQNFC